MKTVTIEKMIHVVSYSCNKNTVCNTLIPENSSFMERKSLWETTCAKCKKIVCAATAFPLK